MARFTFQILTSVAPQVTVREEREQGKREMKGSGGGKEGGREGVKEEGGMILGWYPTHRCVIE